MSFQYTDKQLNELNWDENVYSVNTDFAIRKDFEIVTHKADPKLGETNLIEIDNQEFQVIDTKVDKKTGFDGMAVAPIVDGKPDYNSVAVIAAGTDPDAKDVTIASAQAHPIGMNPIEVEMKTSRDVVSAMKSLIEPSGSPQYKVLDNWIEELQEQNDYTIVQLSGYSQSSYVIKAGAKYGIPTTTFNAWFRYSSLTVAEQEFIRTHPELFMDYRRRGDSVVAWNDGNNPYAAGYDERWGTIRWLDGDDHDVKGWEGDLDSKTGRVINPKTGRPFVEATVNALQSNFLRMKSFEALNSKWKKIDHGTDENQEEIFLDAGQCLIAGTAMAEAARIGLDEMTSLKKGADSEMEKIWSQIDFSIYTQLPYWEVEEIFASHEVTHEKIVSGFHDYTAKKVKKVEKLSETFNTLKTTIDQVVEEKIALDNQLAREFKEWKNAL